MTDAIDLQSQQPGESDNQYIAYLVYRDIGVARTLYDAYLLFVDEQASGTGRIKQRAGTKYRKKGDGGRKNGKTGTAAIPSCFRSYPGRNNWKVRADDWDKRYFKEISDERLEKEREKFLDKIKEAQYKIENGALMAIDTSINSIRIAATKMKQLKEQQDAAGDNDDGAKTYAVAEVARLNQTSIACLREARIELQDSMGFGDIHAAISRVGGGKK